MRELGDGKNHKLLSRYGIFLIDMQIILILKDCESETLFLKKNSNYKIGHKRQIYLVQEEHIKIPFYVKSGKKLRKTPRAAI